MDIGARVIVLCGVISVKGIGPPSGPMSLRIVGPPAIGTSALASIRFTPSATAVLASSPAVAASAATSAPAVAASARLVVASAPDSNKLPIPSPSGEASPAVSPLIKPRLRSPVTAAVPTPVSTPVPRAPNLSAPPRAPNSNGKNASGCPVTGLVVKLPVGDNEAMPATSIGFMCTSIESP